MSNVVDRAKFLNERDWTKRVRYIKRELCSDGFSDDEINKFIDLYRPFWEICFKPFQATDIKVDIESSANLLEVIRNCERATVKHVNDISVDIMAHLIELFRQGRLN